MGAARRHFAGNRRLALKRVSAKIGDNFPAIELPTPAFEDVLSLGEAFQRRETRRVFAPTPLPLDKLSELLWAACGVNRKIGPFGLTGRTDATASNSQEIDVYVAMEMGVYLYDPDRLRLAPILIGDVRPLALDPSQTPAGDRAPVRLIYVADVDRLEHSQGQDEPGLHDAETQKAYYYVDCGIVAANVYLYAAGAGLNAWFHTCDRAALAKRLPLRAGRRVLFAQTVGFPG
jgi:hypothetical protein